MESNILFVINSVLLGAGLAMDAFSVSLADGLNEPEMNQKRQSAVAGTFGLFQGIMPMIGWFLVHTAVTYFSMFEKAVPWIAFLLLGIIGGKMIYEGCMKKTGVQEDSSLTVPVLMMQGVATSIDALSVGFTIAEYNAQMALVSAIIIAAVTFAICMLGISLGRRCAHHLSSCDSTLSDKASILGGCILVLIGLEIFLTGIL